MSARHIATPSGAFRSSLLSGLGNGVTVGLGAYGRPRRPRGHNRFASYPHLSLAPSSRFTGTTIGLHRRGSGRTSDEKTHM